MNQGAGEKFRQEWSRASKKSRNALYSLAIVAMLLSITAKPATAQTNALFSAAGAYDLHPGAVPVGAAMGVFNSSTSYAQLPLMFEQNQGQTDPGVKFLSRGPGYTLFLTKSEAVLSLSQPTTSWKGKSVPSNTAANPHSSVDVVRLRFAAENPDVGVIGENQLPGKTNYFLDGDPRKWHTNIPNYAKVAYQNLYPGVDAVFHGNPQHLEFDLEVAPGADPEQIAFDVSGGSGLRIDEQGNAFVKLSSDRPGEVVLQRPTVFQERQGQRHEISGKFVQRGPNRLGFEIGTYDRTQPLIIDPAISYSTYLSGSLGTFPTGIAVDSSGSAYLVGPAGDGSFPTPSGSVTPPAAAFVTKLNPGGSSLVYTAFVPFDNPSGIGVDSNGSAYLVGGMAGSYIVGGGYENPNFSGADSSALLTVIKLSADGSQVVYAAQIGPQGTVANLGSIAVDGQGNAYVASATNDPTFPTTAGAFQTALFECATGSCDTAPTVSKLSSSGSTLVYSTFLGGYNAYTPADQALAIAVDGQGDAYVTGITDSTEFPTTPGVPQPSCLSAFTPTPPICDDPNVFVTKIDPTGSTLLFSTFLGDGAISDGLIGNEAGIALDSDGNVYVTGTTHSNIFASALTPVLAGPTVNCGQAYGLPTLCAPVDINGAGGSIAFLGKISADGTQLMYLGFLGGTFTSPLPGSTENGATVGTSVAVDSLGKAYVTGYTTSSFFPVTPDALQNSQLTLCDPQTGCGDETFFSILNTELAGTNSLVYSTYLSNASVAGSSKSNTEGLGIATDTSANAYLIGDIRGGSDSFPTTPGAFQTALPSGCFSVGCTDAGFVTRFGGLPAAPHVTFSPSTANFGNVPPGQTGTITLTVSNNGTSPLQVQSWTLTSSSPNPFSATLNACNASLSSLPPSSSCSFTLSFNPSAAGSYNATITFVDNAAQGVTDPNTAGEYDQTFVLAGTSTGLSATTTSVTAAPNPAVPGQFVTLTATVSSGGAPVTSGNVTFSSGGSSIGSPLAVNASGQAVVSTNSLPPGTDTVSASYGATATFAASSASMTVTILQPPAIAKSFSPSTIAVNGVTTLSFTVTNPNAVALSNVEFTDALLQGLLVATPNAQTMSCGGPNVNLTATPGTNTVSLTNATLPANSSCTASVNVIGTQAGTVNNSVTVSVDQGPVGNTATASLTVTALSPAIVSDTESISVSDSVTLPDVVVAETIKVTDQAFVTPLIAVSGPVAYFSSSSIGFGGSSGTQTVMLSNIGQAPMTVQSVSGPSNTAVFQISQVSCSNSSNSFPNTLPAGGVCTFTLMYTAPTGPAPNDSVTFTDSSGLSNLASTPAGSFFQQVLPLSGSGTTVAGGAPPQATVAIPITETINVTDGVTVPDVSVLENITVSDQVSVVALQSITVTPANPAIPAGAPQTFTATGTFTDGSTQNLTSAVTWTSSNTTVATLSGATATGAAPGTSTITATLGSVAGSTTLTVQAPQLAIAANFVSIAVQSNGDYVVTVSVQNTGNIAAAQVNVLFGALVGTTRAPWLTFMSSTTPALNLAPGATGNLVVVFPAASGKPGAQKSLEMVGDATGTNPNGTAANPTAWLLQKPVLTLP